MNTFKIDHKRWKTPTLYRYSDNEECNTYIEKIKEGLFNYDKMDVTPKIKITKNAVFSYSYSQPPRKPQELEFYNQTNKQIKKNLDGDYAIIQNYWMGHYAHNISDNLGRFEYIRQALDSKIKFLLTEFVPGSHKTTLEQLNSLHPFYKNNVMFLHPKDIIKVKGNLLQLEYSENWFPECKKYCRYIVNGLREQVDTTNDKHAHIIFCPRISHLAKNGRCNTNEDIVAIEKMLKNIEKQHPHINISIFRHKDDFGKQMSTEEQKSFFKSATMIIGIHGSALSNIVWADRIVDHDSPPLQVIEFVGNTTWRNSKFPNLTPWQQGNDAGYWNQFGNHYNVEWKHIFFTSTSNNIKDFKFVKIPLDLLEIAIKDSI